MTRVIYLHSCAQELMEMLKLQISLGALFSLPQLAQDIISSIIVAMQCLNVTFMLAWSEYLEC